MLINISTGKKKKKKKRPDFKVHHELKFYQRAWVRDLNLTSCTLRKPTVSRSHAMTASRSASNGKPLWIRNDGNPLCKRLPSIILMTACRQITACRCERDWLHPMIVRQYSHLNTGLAMIESLHFESLQKTVWFYSYNAFIVTCIVLINTLKWFRISITRPYLSIRPKLAHMHVNNCTFWFVLKTETRNNIIDNMVHLVT